MGKNYNIPSLERGIKVVEAVLQEENGLTSLELEERLEIPKTTIFRILYTLQNESWLEKKGDCFVSGHRLILNGMRALRRIELRGIAMPFLDKLSKNTEETAHLGIWAGKKVMVAEVCDGPKHIRIASRAGTLIDPHCSSLGKILLAYTVGSENLESFFEGQTLEQRTPNSITDLNELKSELERVKQNGYAEDNMEYHKDVRCLAAPIRDASGSVVSAVGITATILTFNKSMIPDVAIQVTRIANEISKALGAR